MIGYYTAGQACKIGLTVDSNADNFNQVSMTGLGEVRSKDPQRAERNAGVHPTSYRLEFGGKLEIHARSIFELTLCWDSRPLPMSSWTLSILWLKRDCLQTHLGSSKLDEKPHQQA